MKWVTILVVLIIGLGLSGTAISTEGVYQEDRQNVSVIDSDGIVYKLSFEDSNLRVAVNNPTTREGDHTGYTVRVDNQRVHDADFRLDQNEQRTETINITSGINVNQDEHTVTFSTYGNTTQFNFTREIDSTESGAVPTPHISDVKVANGTAKGEPSAVANVTIVNPSDQIYSTKLMVHTVGTDGSLYPASVRPGDSRTIEVELLDERGAEIAGEARLYTGNMTTEDGALDQVEFAGQAGAETSVWNTSYEPARPTWMNDHYKYENGSYEQDFGEKLSRGHDIEGIPAIYPAIAVLVGLATLRRFR